MTEQQAVEEIIARIHPVIVQAIERRFAQRVWREAGEAAVSVYVAQVAYDEDTVMVPAELLRVLLEQP